MRDKHNYKLIGAYGNGRYRLYEFGCAVHGCNRRYRIFRSVFWSTRSV